MIKDVNAELDLRLKIEENLSANLTEFGDREIFVESATGKLGSIYLKLKEGAVTDDDLVPAAVLMMLLDEDVSAALGLDGQKINTISRFAGENSKVDSFIRKVARHPSFSNKVDQLVEHLKQEDGLEALNRARLQYERVASK